MLGIEFWPDLRMGGGGRGEGIWALFFFRFFFGGGVVGLVWLRLVVRGVGMAGVEGRGKVGW